MEKKVVLAVLYHIGFFGSVFKAVCFFLHVICILKKTIKPISRYTESKYSNSSVALNTKCVLMCLGVFSYFHIGGFKIADNG